MTSCQSKIEYTFIPKKLVSVYILFYTKIMLTF